MNALEKRHHYRNTFFTPSGRLILEDLMKQASFFNAGKGEVTSDMPELIGKRNLINYIFNMLATAGDSGANFRAMIDSFESLPILSKLNKKEDL